MSTHLRLRLRLATGLLATFVATGGPLAQAGVVVEAVPRGGAGESAGLRPGDVLLSWRRAAAPPANPEPAAGAFRTFFDVVEVRVEQAPRGKVEVQGLRGGQPLTATLSEVEPWFLARPQLPPELLADYEAGRQLLRESRVDEGLAIWRRRLLAAEGGLDAEPAASILLGAGRELHEQFLVEPALKLYEQALQQARRPGVRPLVLAMSLDALSGMGKTAAQQLQVAREALGVREAVAPDSLALAGALSAVAAALKMSGQTEAAQAEERRAEELISRLAPGSLAFEVQRLNQVVGLWARGDLAASEQLGRKVLKRVEELAPGSRSLVHVLRILTSVVQHRGSIEGEAFGERAVAIAEHLGREREAAGALINIGDAKVHRGDLEGAEMVLRRADKLYRRTDPESRDHAFVLNNLGEVLAARGDWEAAEALFSRALRIFEAGGLANFEMAQVLANVARADLTLGRLDPAEHRLQQALKLHEESLAGNPAHAVTLTLQGELSERRGDWERAWALHTRALGMFERAGIGGAWQAGSLYRLGLVARQRGYGAEALERLQRGIATVEGASGRAAASDLGRAAFSALYGGLYRETIDLLVDRGGPAEAFALLERWRARWLLLSLAERDLDFGSDVPAELEAARRDQERRYAETRALLARASVLRDPAESERLRGELSHLAEQGQQLAERIRRASPRFAALRYPQALDLAGVQASLDPGSVLLSYSVGPARTLLFVVSAPSQAGAPAGFAHFVLPVGEPELRRRVAAFRKLLRLRHTGPVPTEPELRRAGRELFDLLLAPAAGSIESAQRVLLSPDGPLHTLPFVALTGPGPARSGAKQRYVVEWKPLAVTASATLRAQLRSQPSASPTGRLALAAFGDPATASGPADGERLLTRAARLGVGLERLPASRLEVERLRRGYGASARTFMRAEASEANVQQMAAQADRLHFACHALLDSGSPLNSALVLAPRPGATTPAGDGLLEAWEVLEHVRLHADLVTLSACATGLGQELGGEGLGSLTRAFLFAGARSVVASLWSVADESTADLMTAFYRELRAGTPKDEALRRAQSSLLRGSYRHPFHWAAFQLHGDSR